MYSQNKEEQIILDYFNSSVNMRYGMNALSEQEFAEYRKTMIPISNFLDIGANDGKTLSNTRALAELNGRWGGILVEPSPIAFEALKRNYQGMNNFYFYPFALGALNKKVKMWDSGTHLKKGDHGLLSTMSERDYNKWRPSTEFKQIEVQCFRYKTFLNRVKIKRFDFISIDAEGMDLCILEQIDLRNTSCVCIEWNGNSDLKDKFSKLMIGFDILYTSGENLIFGRTHGMPYIDKTNNTGVKL